MDNNEKSIVKQKFESAEIIVIKFDSDDIIATSTTDDFNLDEVTFP